MTAEFALLVLAIIVAGPFVFGIFLMLACSLCDFICRRKPRA